MRKNEQFQGTENGRGTVKEGTKMTNYFTHDKKSWWSMLILIAVATLGVPCVTFAAERPAGHSSGYNISSPRPQGTHSHGFHRSRFFGADGFNEVEVTVEQSQSAPTME
jgi:hypothetical protein